MLKYICPFSYIPYRHMCYENVKNANDLPKQTTKRYSFNLIQDVIYEGWLFISSKQFTDPKMYSPVPQGNNTAKQIPISTINISNNRIT